MVVGPPPKLSPGAIWQHKKSQHWLYPNDVSENNLSPTRLPVWGYLPNAPERYSWAVLHHSANATSRAADI